MKKIQEIQEEITDLIDPDDLETEMLNHLEFEQYISKEIVELVKFIEKHSKAGSETTVTATSRNEQQIKLPKIELKKFNEDPLNWRTFLDSFECAVDKNEYQSSVEKMNYLINLVSGPAEKTISGLSLCNRNYEIALNALKERYGNE